MSSLAPMQVYRDVPVVPVHSVASHIASGGPIWPDFDQQLVPRHCRDGVAVDKAAPMPLRTHALRRPAVWGGYLNLHFGHLIIEQMTRLPQSLQERPDDVYLFTLPKRQTADALPAWVWQILDWHGVPRNRVWLVTRAVIARELRVAAQGEMMGTQDTQGAYLDLLDQNTARRGLVPDPAEVVFVTREGLVAKGQGGHAGEGYLAQALQRSGVRVVDPVKHTVSEQLAIYAGARVLIFAEGSAIHGRLLLGRRAQDIHVLRRRPHRDLAAEALRPRCQSLRYHATVGRRLGARMQNGAFSPNLTAALYDLAVVFDLFAGLGHDLQAGWDDAAYHAACLQDLQGWLRNRPTDPQQLLENLDLLSQAGFDIDAVQSSAAQ